MTSQYINKLYDFKDDNKQFRVKCIKNTEIIYELCSSDDESEDESNYSHKSDNSSSESDNSSSESDNSSSESDGNIISTFKNVTIEEYNSDNSIGGDFSSDDDSDSYNSDSSDNSLPA